MKTEWTLWMQPQPTCLTKECRVLFNAAAKWQTFPSPWTLFTPALETANVMATYSGVAEHFVTFAYAKRVRNSTPNTFRQARQRSIIEHYNNGMQGVDRFDRFCSSYKICTHKQLSWKKAARLAFLKMAIVNAYILFKKDKRMSKLTQRNFIEKVLDQWACQLNCPRLWALSNQSGTKTQTLLSL